MSKRAVAALLCLLPLGAEARDRLHERDNWIVEYIRSDPPASPFCLAVTLAEDRPGRTLSLAVFGDGSATLLASGLDGEASGPSTNLSVLEIDGTRWALDWKAGEVAAHAAIEERARAERLARQLAEGSAATLRDRQGRALAAFPLAAAGPALAALGDCMATRLADAPRGADQSRGLQQAK
jgi:hypothetical protein